MENSKPKFLYRGVTVTEEILKNNSLFEVDLVPPKPAKYDEMGRKTVNDGNEYGVYMSDYRPTAEKYAAVSIYEGTPINPELKVGDLHLCVPAVGILYKISTDNLDVHKPWITGYLTGHYNNGYHGDEWIAERIPANNYTVEEITIGADILHPQKEISFTNSVEALSKINEELTERRKRLERLEAVLKHLPQHKVSRMAASELAVYKEIFKKDGLFETDLDKFEVSTGNDCAKLMMAYFYKKSPDDIPMAELKYLMNLQSSKSISLLDLNKEILHSLKDNIEQREAFVQKRKQQGKEANTESFDKRYSMFCSMLELYHKIVIKKATEITGVTFDKQFNSIDEIKENEKSARQKLKNLYDDANISNQVYLAMLSEMREEVKSTMSSFSPPNGDKGVDNSDNDCKSR